MFVCDTISLDDMKKKYVPFNKSIVYAAELMTKAFKEAARKFHKNMNFEINHEEFIVLESIYTNPGIIQINIAKNILMKRSYVCKFLVQLEEKGYIYKKQAIRGKRQIIMENYITPEGEKVYKKVVDFIEKDIEKCSTEYNLDDLERITNIMFDWAEKIKKECNLKY